jgi:hypothetical protein
VVAVLQSAAMLAAASPLIDSSILAMPCGVVMVCCVYRRPATPLLLGINQNI